MGVQRQARLGPWLGALQLLQGAAPGGRLLLLREDPDFGPGFIKTCTYFPYPAKVWVNGNEWAKRQAARAGIGFRALANGFAACDQPERLQEICDGFGPDAVQGFFDRWIGAIPVPLTAADRAAGYW